MTNYVVEIDVKCYQILNVCKKPDKKLTNKRIQRKKLMSLKNPKKPYIPSYNKPARLQFTLRCKL